MVVMIRVFGMLRSILKKEELVVHLVGDTVEDLINQLAAEYCDEVREELLNEEGNLDYSYALFVKNQRLGSLSTQVEDGDEVVIISMLAGG